MARRSVKTFVWRWVSGAQLDGERKTNATAFRFGTSQLHPTEQKPARWSYWPRYIKGSIRVLGTLYAGVLVWAWFSGQEWLDYATAGIIVAYCIIDVGLFIVDKRRENEATRIPRKVIFKDVEKFVRRINCADTPLIGLAMGKQPVMLDLDNDAPHGALSMGTGAGKSATLGGIIAQLLYGGAEHVLIIDVKVISLMQFENHPRVTYANTYEAMWEGLLHEERIMNDRYQELLADNKKIFPRRVIIMEEGNSFASEIAMYYRTEMGGKGRVPIIDTLGRILFKGRQARMNVIGAWQRLTVQAVADPAVRDQFGFKILARFSVTAWKSLIGTFPIPRSSRHRGRAVIVVGDEQEAFQMVYWTPQETRDFAFANDQETVADVLDEAYRRDLGELNGTGSKGATTSEPVAEFSLVSPSVSNNGSKQDEPVSEPVDYPVTLQEAIKGGIVIDLSYEGLRSAKSRGGQFPSNVGKRGREHIYSSNALREWDQKRRVN